MRKILSKCKLKQRRAVLGLFVLFGLAMVLASNTLAAGSPTTPTGGSLTEVSGETAPPQPDLTLEDVKAIAERESQEAEEALPQSMQVALGGMRQAMAIMDPNMTVPTSTSAPETLVESPAYLVVMTGSFALGSAPVPYGHKAPSGTVLELVINAHTGFVHGRYVGKEISGDISRLGVAKSLE